jgi:hypothetical protein
MRNDEVRTKRILGLVENLPSFGAANLAPTGEKRAYLNIILSRQAKRGTVVHLRKNLYVSKTYLDTAERIGFFEKLLVVP